MLVFEDIAEWMKAQGITEYVHFGEVDRLPASRHTAYIMAESGGFGLMTERMLDRPTFQVISQGAGGQTAFEMAYRLDALLLDANTPLSIGSMHVIDIGRVGGAPAYIGRDDDNHVAYSTNYWMSIGRVAMT